MQSRVEAADVGIGAPSVARIWWRIAPALAAGLYPSFSQALSQILIAAHASASPDGWALWGGVAGSLVLAFAVMAISFRTVQKSNGADSADFRARCVAHTAFATPSLLVAFGNLAGVLHLPAIVSIGWPVFWAVLALLALTPGGMPLRVTRIGASGYRRLGIAHGISASAILALFVAPHLTNHTAGIFSGMAHLEFMKTARLEYRNGIVQPLLLLLILFQVASGVTLLQRRLRTAGDFFGNLQTLTGVYVGMFLLSHLIAVFGARYAGTNTDWNWLTNHDHSMLASLANLRLIGHYWFGPVAILTHAGCGLRMVLREHAWSPHKADIAPRAAMALGGALSTVILLGLLGVHIG
ncbi:MAG TPA: hypothetical protein VFW28_10920 [Micropepsaceae bacterium]|nr:hypothetical protein [Micropepsaceae bacterium]